MKLSEMSTVQASKALINIMQPLQNILQDETILPGLQAVMDEESAEGMMALILKKVAPELLKNHTMDFCAIIAALNGKTAKQVSEQSLLQTMADVKNSLDKELLDFFKSSGSVQTGEESA